MLGHILLISAQVGTRRGVPVLEEVTFGVFAEVQRIVVGATSGVRRLWTGYADLRGLRAENEALKRDLAAAQVAAQQQRAAAERAKIFERLLNLRDESQLQMAAAEI